MLNKRLLSISLIAGILSVGSMNAVTLDTTGFCPITKGLTLKYANYDDDYELESYYVMSVLSSEGTLSDGRVVFDQSFFDDDLEPEFRNNSLKMTVTVKNGKSVSEMDDLTKLMKVQEDICSGDASSIPTSLKVGMKIPDGHLEIKAGAVTATIITSERTVADYKKITVKAGTFDAYLIKEKQTTKSMVNKEEIVESWYAKGIGCIKQEVYNKKGKLKISRELVSVSYK